MFHNILEVFEYLTANINVPINGHLKVALKTSQLLISVSPYPLLFNLEAGFEQFRVAEKAHGSWMKLYLEGNTSEVLTNMGKKVLKQYLEALAAMSSALSKQLGKYDMYSMIAGMVFVFQVSRRISFSKG